MMQSLLLGIRPITASSVSNANGYEFFHSSSLNDAIRAVVVRDNAGNIYGINKSTYFKVGSNGSLAWQKDLPSVYGTTTSAGLTTIAVSPNGSYLVICGNGGTEGFTGYGQSAIVSHINTSTGDSIKHYLSTDQSVAQANRWGSPKDVIVSDDGKCNVCGDHYRVSGNPFNEFLRILIDLNTQIMSSIGDTDGTYMETWQKINDNATHIVMGGLDVQNVQAGYQTYNWTKMERDTENIAWSKTWQSNYGNGVRGNGVCIIDNGTVFAGYKDDTALESGIVAFSSLNGDINNSVKIHKGANDFDDLNFEILDTDSNGKVYFVATEYGSGVANWIIGAYDYTNQSLAWARTLKRTTTATCFIASLKYNAAREELDISGRSVEIENEMNDRSFFLSLPADGSGIGSYGSYIYEPVGLSCTVNTLSWYSGTPPTFGGYTNANENGGSESDVTRISGFGLYPDLGQELFTEPGTYGSLWTCPTGVNSISVVAVGAGGMGTADQGPGGGGGGGGLGWKNNISVTPGQSYSFVVGEIATQQSGGNSGTSYFIDTNTVAGLGGNGNGNTGVGGAGGGYVGDGGGNGGSGGSVTNPSSGNEAGGGGAGGYSGNGGDGGSGDGLTASGTGAAAGGDGAGGAGGGGGYSGSYTGGGVRLYGEGPSGLGGAYQGTPFGSGQTGSHDGTSQSPEFGGGGAGAVGQVGSDSGRPGQGALRIIWGTNRLFPATNTADQYPI